MKVTSYADIPAREPKWLWRGYIPQDEFLLIAGKRGTGKGILWSRIIAAITNGDPMPGEEIGREPLNVLTITNEDDPNTAMAWRLRAAGANLNRVFDATEGFSIPSQLDSLRDKIEEYAPVGMVHIDPLADASEISLRSSEKRIREELVNPLRFDIAKELGVVVSTVVHVTKQGRTVGAGALEDAARHVLKIDRLDSDKRIRLIHVEKTNMGSDDVADIPYTIEGTWRDPVITFPDLANAPARELSTIQRILQALDDAGHALSTPDIVERAGIKSQTGRTALSRAKDDGILISPRRGVWDIPTRTQARVELQAVK